MRDIYRRWLERIEPHYDTQRIVRYRSVNRYLRALPEMTAAGWRPRADVDPHRRGVSVTWVREVAA